MSLLVLLPRGKGREVENVVVPSGPRGPRKKEMVVYVTISRGLRENDNLRSLVSGKKDEEKIDAIFITLPREVEHRKLQILLLSSRMTMTIIMRN